MGTRKPLVAGNWKMNGLKAAGGELKKMGSGAAKLGKLPADLWICPPAHLLIPFSALVKGTALKLGGQDCHAKASGAHTGDISAEMLKDAGAKAVIVGHSERRQDHGEDDKAVRAKAEAAWRAGLVAIICVGETLAERDAKKTKAVVQRQIMGSVPEGATAATTVIAYEPVWAIGTGRTPTGDEVRAVHAAIRALLRKRFGGEADKIRILYGGSVKPDNAATLLTLPDVDGALVGGASLKAADFLSIAKVYARQPNLTKSVRRDGA